LIVQEVPVAVERAGRLRIGVVGLGRLWEARHKPALLSLADRFRVTAVYDQVARRAEMEADSLCCAATEGLAALVDRPDVDAVYLLSPQWFGLHAAELACRRSRPIYCALPLAGDPDGVESLAKAVRGCGVLFVPELARRFYPATLRLRELLATTLGEPRLVQAHVRLFTYDRYGAPGPSTQLAPLPLCVDPGGNLIDWCCWMFQQGPRSIQAAGTRVLTDPDRAAGTSTDDDYETFTLEFSGGALAQVSVGRFHRAAWHDATRFLPPPGIQVFAERGVAWLEMPDRIQWTDREGAHDERLPLDPPVGEALNDHFDRRLRGVHSMAPTIDDALAVSRIVQALHRSRREGRAIRLDADEPR
jgi:predicted dehydrogenase